jgi:hypothetical protein
MRKRMVVWPPTRVWPLVALSAEMMLFFLV